MIQTLLVNNIRLPITSPEEESFEAAKKKLKLAAGEFRSAALHKRSIDARHRSGSDTVFVCSVMVECELDARRLEALASLPDVRLLIREEPKIEIGSEKLESRPAVIGFGPCGMFAALLLAEQGYRPLVIERGGDLAERQRAVEEFHRTGRLDTETNIQFGAGGAGTFSDGKLVTRINDPVCHYVLERFRAFGAPSEIVTAAKPHVGTDKLLSVVGNIRERIEALGGEILFHTRLTGFGISGGKIRSLKLERAGQRFECEAGAVILAIGHSARDTFEMLDQSGIAMIAKPFSVGVRVEHLQREIDAALYAKDADRIGSDGKRLLPPGEYSLSWREGKRDTDRGVYSFCMCPGGEVVAAASEEGGVVVNGMSRYARDGRNANAAIAVSVFPSDTGGGWRDGITFQRQMERAAFVSGGGDYRAPVQTLGDFLAGKTSHLTEPGRIQPTYRESSGAGYTLCDLGTVLPPFVSRMLREGFPRFGRMIRGFDTPDAILTGVETRTSSPLRIVRGEERTASAADNLYPCGEGAGYAGGITSAAADGVNTALALMRRYGPTTG